MVWGMARTAVDCLSQAAAERVATWLHGLRARGRHPATPVTHLHGSRRGVVECKSVARPTGQCRGRLVDSAEVEWARAGAERRCCCRRDLHRRRRGRRMQRHRRGGRRRSTGRGSGKHRWRGAGGRGRGRGGQHLTQLPLEHLARARGWQRGQHVHARRHLVVRQPATAPRDQLRLERLGPCRARAYLGRGRGGPRRNSGSDELAEERAGHAKRGGGGDGGVAHQRGLDL
jgi:hypothetical protein